MKAFPFLPLVLVGLAHGQVYTPPPETAPTPSPPPNAAARGRDSGTGALGQEFPLLDPSAETLSIGGITIPLGDNRLLKARFEKFLNSPPEDSDAALEYRETIAAILATISPFHEGGPNLSEAFKMLPLASAYPGDANICSSLAESIYLAMLSKQDVNGLNQLNQTMEKEKDSLIRKADSQARLDRATEMRETRSEGRGRAETTRSRVQREGTGAQSVYYKEMLRRIAEIESLKKANIARTEAQTIRTKAQYQVNMVQWFVQRRYEHVLMAARFYNQIWKDGDATLRIREDSDVGKLFSESVGVSPTVSSLDALSSEMIREVEKYVQAFDLLLERGDLHSASQRLMEAYAIGEYLSPVATLPLEKKLRVAEYARDLHQLYDSLQAHDYTRAKDIAARLKVSARDFPSSKFDSAIAGYTLASDMAIEAAKVHLYARETDKVAEKIQEATEIWPTNPKLAEFRNLVSNSGAVVLARNDFDRLLSEGNYREIARRQYEFAPAVQGDPAREDAFKQIITNLTRIEAALAKAAEFSRMSQDYAAWEQLAELRETFPDDPKLGRELELLAPKVADFTKALDRAHQFESRTPKQTGSALAWYLKARTIHPRSHFAEQGIQRLLDEILPPDGTAAN